jgi:hypothetical protein
MNDPLPVTVRPLTPSRFKDLEAVFEAQGCAIARGCWCMFYRETGRTAVPKGARLADVRKESCARCARPARRLGCWPTQAAPRWAGPRSARAATFSSSRARR